MDIGLLILYDGDLQMDIKAILIDRFTKLELEITDTGEVFKVTNPVTGNGVTVNISKLNSMYEVSGEKVVEEYVYYIDETLQSDKSKIDLENNLDQIFPVIRSTSFPKSGLVYTEHTAETNVFFAFDMGSGYHLIDAENLALTNLSVEQLLEVAKENLSKKSFQIKKQIVAGNDFYFVNTNDGYDASRILLVDKLKKMKADFEGECVISTPHQDVLIIADVKKPSGYDIIAHLCMDFFSRGDIPITSLSLKFDGENLEPIFIMAKGTVK